MMRRTIQNVAIILAIAVVVVLNAALLVLWRLTNTPDIMLVRLYVSMCIAICIADILAVLLFIDALLPSPTKAKVAEPIRPAPRKGKTRNA